MLTSTKIILLQDNIYVLRFNLTWNVFILIFFIISLTDGLIASDSVIVHHHHQQADTLNVKVNQ